MIEDSIDKGPEDQKHSHHQKMLTKEGFHIERLVLVKEKGTTDHNKERNSDSRQ